MPKYTYICKKCNFLKDFNFSIKEYVELEKEDFFNKMPCSSCGSIGLARKVSAPFGKVERRKEEIVQKAKEEARSITNKIREGDQGAIRDIFGDNN